MLDRQQQLPVFSAVIYTQISTVFEAYLDYRFSSRALPLRWDDTQAGIVCVNIRVLSSAQHAQNGVRVASVLSGTHTRKLKRRVCIRCGVRMCAPLPSSAVLTVTAVWVSLRWSVSLLPPSLIKVRRDIHAHARMEGHTESRERTHAAHTCSTRFIRSGYNDSPHYRRTASTFSGPPGSCHYKLVGLGLEEH